MTITVDTSRFEARLAALADALPAAIATHLPDAAFDALLRSGYADATPDEQGAPDLLSLITDIEADGQTATVGIVQLYDWVLEEGHQHCQSADGHDCPSFAANGPYTADTLPATPGDGTTPCGALCFCQVVPREPTFLADAPAALAAAGAAALASAIQAAGR